MKKFSVIAPTLTIGLFLILCLTGNLWGLYQDFTRPNPLMDYVPQEMGIYDTGYEELTEADCRNCHGNSLADRHHLTDPVVIYNVCEPCHEVIDVPPYVVVTRDCLTGGCHSTDDLLTNGWHHYTNMSAAGDCTACHNPNLIAEISPFQGFVAYPPSIVTPTPFSCENCHWEQDFSTTGDPSNPGHPSTYDHYNAADLFVGFYEYSKPIYLNAATHHMGGPNAGFLGNVSSQCYRCHSTDPHEFPQVSDPYNPELIRFCEICHSPASLHGIAPHRSDTNGWQAVGFHANNNNPSDRDPEIYRTWEPTGYEPPEETDGFTLNQMCFGCHGDNVPGPPPVDECSENMPVIDTSAEGIQPKVGTYGSQITLRGENFGDEQNSQRKVQMKLKDCSAQCWINMTVVSWTDTRIQFRVVPYWEFTPGNYKIRVKTECGKSNRVTFSLKDWISVHSISPQEGPCGTWIDIIGLGFGDKQTKMSADNYHGEYHTVQFASSQGTFTAKKYDEWSNTSIRMRFKNFFEDGIDPVTGEHNFVRDDGTVDCALEPNVKNCADMAVGSGSIYAISVYFGDEDLSGDLSCGDTIFQVVTSNPHYFELTAGPQIYSLNPRELERKQRLKIIGVNFGPTQMNGEVRIGSKKKAEAPELGQGKLLDCVTAWSNTKIKVKFKVPKKWIGKTKYVWVEKAGVKSNYREVEILEPLPEEEPAP